MGVGKPIGRKIGQKIPGRGGDELTPDYHWPLLEMSGDRDSIYTALPMPPRLGDNGVVQYGGIRTQDAPNRGALMCAENAIPKLDQTGFTWAGWVRATEGQTEESQFVMCIHGWGAQPDGHFTAYLFLADSTGTDMVLNLTCVMHDGSNHYRSAATPAFDALAADTFFACGYDLENEEVWVQINNGTKYTTDVTGLPLNPSNLSRHLIFGGTLHAYSDMTLRKPSMWLRTPTAAELTAEYNKGPNASQAIINYPYFLSRADARSGDFDTHTFEHEDISEDLDNAVQEGQLQTNLKDVGTTLEVQTGAYELTGLVLVAGGFQNHSMLPRAAFPMGFYFSVDNLPGIQRPQFGAVEKDTFSNGAVPTLDQGLNATGYGTVQFWDNGEIFNKNAGQSIIGDIGEGTEPAEIIVVFGGWSYQFNPHEGGSTVGFTDGYSIFVELGGQLTLLSSNPAASSKNVGMFFQTGINTARMKAMQCPNITHDFTFNFTFTNSSVTDGYQFTHDNDTNGAWIHIAIETLPSAGDVIKVYLRWADADNCWFVEIDENGDVRLVRRQSAIDNPEATNAAGLDNETVLSVRMDGDRIEGFKQLFDINQGGSVMTDVFDETNSFNQSETAGSITIESGAVRSLSGRPMRGYEALGLKTLQDQNQFVEPRNPQTKLADTAINQMIYEGDSNVDPQHPLNRQSRYGLFQGLCGGTWRARRVSVGGRTLQNAWDERATLVAMFSDTTGVSRVNSTIGGNDLHVSGTSSAALITLGQNFYQHLLDNGCNHVFISQLPPRNQSGGAITPAEYEIRAAAYNAAMETWCDARSAATFIKTREDVIYKDANDRDLYVGGLNDADDPIMFRDDPLGVHYSENAIGVLAYRDFMENEAVPLP
jgi:hypothetical protein